MHWLYADGRLALQSNPAAFNKAAKESYTALSADEKQELHDATDSLTESKSVQVELTKKQVTKMTRQKFQKIQKIVSTDNILSYIYYKLLYTHSDNFN